MKFFASLYRKKAPPRRGGSFAPARARTYYHPRAPRGPRRLLPLVVISASAVIALFFVIVFATRARFEEITHPPHLDEQIVRGAIQNHLRKTYILRPFRRSFLFFDEKALATALEREFKTVNASLNRKSYRSYALTIQDRIPIAEVISGTESYLIDPEGIVVNIHDQGVERGLPVISLLSIPDKSASIEIGNPVQHRDEVVRLLDFYKRVGELTPVSRAQLSVERIPWQIEFESREGWKIFFLYDEKLDEQFERLRTLLREVQEAHPKRYIDLRYGDRVYYQ